MCQYPSPCPAIAVRGVTLRKGVERVLIAPIFESEAPFSQPTAIRNERKAGRTEGADVIGDLKSGRPQDVDQSSSDSQVKPGKCATALRCDAHRKRRISEQDPAEGSHAPALKRHFFRTDQRSDTACSTCSSVKSMSATECAADIEHCFEAIGTKNTPRSTNARLNRTSCSKS